MLLGGGRFFDGSGSVPVLLNALSLDNLNIDDAAPEDTVVGNVINTTAGSALSLQNDAGGRFKLVSDVVKAGATPTDYDTAQSHDITIRETLAGAANSPRDSVIGIAVNNPGDPNFANTVLLLSGDGANGSTTFTDESAAARGNATVVGNAQVSTAVKKFGTGSIRLDGTGDSLTFPSHSDFNLGGDFTIDVWARYDAGHLASGNCLVSRYNATTGQRCWLFDYNGGLRFYVSPDGGAGAAQTVLSYSWTPTADTFYLQSVDRSGNVWRMYLDGVMVAKTTSTIIPATFAQALRIGDLNSGGDDLGGYIDEVRITNGVARYASDSGFTPPTGPFPRF